MIGFLGAFIAGITLKDYSLLLAPLLYSLSRKNRDWGLLGYLILLLYSSSKLSFTSLYTYSGTVGSLTYGLSLLLLLDDVLTAGKSSKAELSVIPVVLIGLIFPEALILGTTFVLLLRLGFGRRWLIPIALPSVFLLLRRYLDVSGGVYNQVAVIGGVTLVVLAATAAGRNLKKMEMFRA